METKSGQKGTALYWDRDDGQWRVRLEDGTHEWVDEKELKWVHETSEKTSVEAGEIQVNPVHFHTSKFFLFTVVIQLLFCALQQRNLIGMYEA